MINSSIASSHYYYIMLFKNHSLKSNDLMTLFGDEKHKRQIVGDAKITHTQKVYEYRSKLGSLSLLGKKENQVEDKNEFWYDYYLGSMTLGEDDLFFISFPYKTMQERITKLPQFKKSLYYVPHVPKILERMEEKQGKEIVGEVKNEITKYTALVKETKKAERIHILGQNPLDSSIYQKIKAIDGVKVRASSLKLKCTHESLGHIEVTFDKYGNFRFWLPRETAEEEILKRGLKLAETEYVQALNMIPVLYQTFYDLGFLDTTEELSSYNTLEDE